MHSAYHAPGFYLIRVAGRLDANWSDRLGGLAIVETGSKAGMGVPIMELSGWLADQAALWGILKTLYDYQCQLLYVEHLGAAQDEVVQAAGDNPMQAITGAS